MKSTPADEVAVTPEIQELLNYRDFLHSALEKLWLIVLCLLIALFLGAAWAKRTPPSYLAQATIQINPGDRRTMDIGKSEQLDYYNGELRNTFIENMKSETLMLRVVRAASLAAEPDFLPVTKDGRVRGEKELAGALSQMVSASMVKNTRLIAIMAEHTSPILAQKIANTVALEFIRQNVERGATASKMTLEFLMDEADRQKKKLEAAETDLQAFKLNEKSISFNANKDLVLERLRDLTSKATQAKSARMNLDADYSQIKKLENDPDGLLTIPSVLTHPTIFGLRQGITGQEADIATLALRYKDKHPKMIQAKSRLDELKSQLRSAALRMPALIASELEKAKASEASYADVAKQQEELALTNEGKSIGFNFLSRQVDTERAMYEAIIHRVKETDITKDIDTDAIQMIQEAGVPGVPFKPNVKKIMIIAFFAGLIAAMSFVYILHILDTSVKTVDQVESLTSLTVVGAIPGVKLKGKNKKSANVLPTLEAPDSTAAEAFRSFRAAVALIQRGTPDSQRKKSLLFTSALPGEGKSFSASNFAITLSQQGINTVIVDADLRRPTLHKLFFDEKNSPAGLAEYLDGSKTLADLVRPTAIPNLSVISAGMNVGRPAELLANGASLIESMELTLCEKYDFVIFDTAPINILGDTSLLVPYIHSVCLVVRACRTARRAVLRAIDLVRQADGELIGIAMNRLPSDQRSYYYYGYYHYYNEKYGKKAYADSAADVRA